jgi:predicted amidophosphoribosyltransferase
LFNYRDEVRELIVRTKSRGGPAQFAGCVDLFLADSRTSDAAAWCDAIAAAPASFWTRIRGRPHLATELAAALARHHRRALIHIVPPVLWRFRKRAMTAREDRGRDGQGGDAGIRYRIVARQDCQRILLIDDVRTTGGTLAGLVRQLGARFPGSQVETLVLAAT